MDVSLWNLISGSLLSKPKVDVLLQSSIMKTRLDTHATTELLFIQEENFNGDLDRLLPGSIGS